jgi:hypothetical protein
MLLDPTTSAITVLAFLVRNGSAVVSAEPYLGGAVVRSHCD